MKGKAFLLIVCGLYSCSVQKKTKPSDSFLSDKDERHALFASLYVDGVSARLRNDWDEALKKMEECRKWNPTVAAVYYEMALSLHLSGKSPQALEYASTAWNLEPNNKWYGFFYSDLLANQGKQPAALRVLETLSNRHPDDEEIPIQIAEGYRSAGQIDKALEWYEKSEKKSGVSEEITLGKVSLLQQKKNYPAIEREYKKLIHSDSTECRFRNYLAEYYLQTQLEKQAESEFEKLFMICPDYAPALITLAGFYIEELNFTKGMKYILQLLRSPEVEISIKSKVLGALERSYTENRGHTELEKGLKQGIHIFYDLHPACYESHFWMARFYTLYHPLPDSAHYFTKKSLHYDKTHPELWKEVVDYLTEKKAWDSAFAYVHTATELYPNDAYFFLQKGKISFYLKNYRTCIQDLKYAMEIPGLERKEILQSLYFIARSYYHLGENDLSDQHFENILKMNADFAPALNDYAWSLVERGKHPEKAEKMARKAYELNPDNPHYADTYGLVLIQLKKYSEAMDKFQLALSLSPGNPLYLEHIGDTFSLMGKTEEARKYWENALQNGGSRQLLEKKIKTGKTTLKE